MIDSKKALTAASMQIATGAASYAHHHKEGHFSFFDNCKGQVFYLISP